MEKCIIKDEVKLNSKLKKEFSGYGLYDSKNPVKEINNRYYLELELNLNKEPALVAFMINPSKTFPEINGKRSTIDGTIKNLIKISYKNYSKLIVLNLYSTINPEQKELKRNPINDNFIKNFLNKDIEKFNKADLLIACGHDKKRGYIDEIKEIIKAYRKKFKKILYLSVDTEKFKKFIDSEGDNFILHPTNRIIDAYGGFENIALKDFEL